MGAPADRRTGTIEHVRTIDGMLLVTVQDGHARSAHTGVPQTWLDTTAHVALTPVGPWVEHRQGHATVASVIGMLLVFAQQQHTGVPRPTPLAGPFIR